LNGAGDRRADELRRLVEGLRDQLEAKDLVEHTDETGHTYWLRPGQREPWEDRCDPRELFGERLKGEAEPGEGRVVIIDPVGDSG
jgi:hypothetical protein